MAASPIVRSLNAELDELRRVLDSPNPLGHAHPLKSPTGGAHYSRNSVQVSNNQYAEFSAVLGNAETNVARLSHAMESAEHEMDNAYKRSTELSRSAVERKEAEVQELRKVLAAKERALDSLRDTMSTTRRVLEDRLKQAESREAAKEAEVKQLRAELYHIKSSSESLTGRVEMEVKATRQVLEDADRKEMMYKQRERDLESTLTNITSEQEKTISTLARIKGQKDQLKVDNERLSKELKSMTAKVDEEVSMRREVTLKLERERKYRKMADRKDAAYLSIADLELAREMEKKLKVERKLRKGAEKYLQSERYSREELEGLLLQMRDLAISRPDMELRELRRTVDLLKDESRDRIWRAEEDMLRKHRDFDSVYNSLERDNVKLRDEIRKTRRMVRSAVSRV